MVESSNKILLIVLCMSSFQDYLFLLKFLLKIDGQSIKYVIEKNIQNIVQNIFLLNCKE
jgi:hypothetical protein